MPKPRAIPGLVIKYDYLWRDEHQQGREEGHKYRPCVIVSASPVTAGRVEKAVILAAITHSAPEHGDNAVRIPIKVGYHLGLDASQSWIITSEVNKVSWNDPGIIPAKPTQKWAYGQLPKALYEDVRSSLLRHRKLAKVDRTDD